MPDDSLLIPKLTPDSGLDTETPNQEVVIEKPKAKLNKKLLIGSGILLFFILIYTIPLLIFGVTANKQYKNNISPVITSFDSADLGKVKDDITTIKDSLAKVMSSYKLISWMRITPFAGKYVSDLGHGLKGATYSLEAAQIGIDTVSPYLSVLGYVEGDQGSGVASESGEITAQERIDFIVSAIPEIVPKTGEIAQKMSEAKIEFSYIDSNRYPEKYKGKEIRGKLKAGLDMFDMAATYVSQSKPLLEVAPYLLGIDGERRYLVLFQNDKELRPTGGFMTAYSIMSVENAKFEPVSSDDIYHLDAIYKPTIPAPQPIVDLIKGPYVLSQNLRLRDMNYSPDFEVAMDLFTEETSKINLEETDGIIAVDTGLLVNLLDAMGEIGVPGFGNFSTKIEPKCNCPQVIYELESFADVEGPIIWDPLTGEIILTPPNHDNRKKIIGPLMNSILANAMAQPKEKLPGLFNAVFTSLIEKHVLFYLYDDQAQMAVSDFGIGGKIRDYQGDFLHINDSNLGGRKSNLYVTQEVEQEIEVAKDGQIIKTVTITYKNPEKYDGWLNSVLPNWVRIYVPQGSTLIDAEGLEKQYDSVEELGKTAFSGYFQLRPEGVSKVTFKYSLPFKMNGDYKMLIQKQPGTDKPLYIIRTNKFEDEFFLNTDREVRVKI